MMIKLRGSNMAEIELVAEGKFSIDCTGTGQSIRLGSSKDQIQNKVWTPVDFLLISWGSCVLMTLELEAQKLGLEIKGANVRLFKEVISVPMKKVSKVSFIFSHDKVFDSMVTDQLEKACKSCTVTQSLHPDIKMEYIFNWGTK